MDPRRRESDEVIPASSRFPRAGFIVCRVSEARLADDTEKQKGNEEEERERPDVEGGRGRGGGGAEREAKGGGAGKGGQVN